MAQGPDPNRDFASDRDNTPEEIERGGGLGDPGTTRFGLSSWAIALLAVVLVVVLIALMR